jgi:hypothetical protein
MRELVVTGEEAEEKAGAERPGDRGESWWLTGEETEEKAGG